MILRLLLALLLFGAAVPAHAAPVTWYIGAVVREMQVSGPAGGDSGPLSEALTSLGAVVGADLSASIRFETSTIDTYPENANWGFYDNAIDVLDVTIGAWSLVFGGSDSSVSVRSPPTFGPLQGEILYGRLLDPAGILDLDAAYRADLIPQVNSGLFPTDALSAVPPPLSSLVQFFPGGLSIYDYGTVAILGGCGSLGCATFYAEIVAVSAVPEPAAATLLGVGFAALAALRSRRSS